MMIQTYQQLVMLVLLSAVYWQDTLVRLIYMCLVVPNTKAHLAEDPLPCYSKDLTSECQNFAGLQTGVKASFGFNNNFEIYLTDT